MILTFNHQNYTIILHKNMKILMSIIFDKRVNLSELSELSELGVILNKLPFCVSIDNYYEVLTEGEYTPLVGLSQ